MTGTSRAATRPWLVLGGWVLVVAVLALLGRGIADRLSPTSLLVPGTPSARAQAMLERQFGNSVAVTVLLQGPARRDRPPGAAPRGRPAPRGQGAGDVALGLRRGRPTACGRGPSAALIVAGFERPESEAMSEVVPTAQRSSARTCGRRSAPTWAGSPRSPRPCRRTRSTPPTTPSCWWCRSC